ncbi:MAG: isoprenylcysteine carboxyl methyltransferase family protein [Rubrobacter sp.]|nr:isoprenylcysteine carboxyl methyltransferase family protein [Rubrobacter sp.]
MLISVVVLIAAQRLLELGLARHNERKARVKGAVERGREHYPFIVALHSLWLVSTLVEGMLRGPEFPTLWPVSLALFILVQLLRYWAIFSLGESWNTKILVVPSAKLVRRGPYRYLSHPNYVVVVVEILTLPLIFGAWVTALVFTVLNAILLYIRIREENRALTELSGPGQTPTR